MQALSEDLVGKLASRALGEQVDGRTLARLRPSANEGTCMRAALVVVSCLAVAGRGDEALSIAERWIEVTRRASGTPSLRPRSLLGFLLNLKALALLTGGRLHESEAVAKKEYQKNLAPLTHPWVGD